MTCSHVRAGLAGRVFDGVIFDMDQTLVNSMPAINRSWTAWATHYRVPAERFVNMHGLHAGDIIRLLLPEHLWDEATERIARLETADVADVEPMPGAVAALTSLPLDRVAVATSAIEELMHARLEAAGLPRPGVLIHRGMVARGKPAPDIFLLAAERLGIAADRALVVEDAPAGVEGAAAAGMASLGVLTTTPADDLPADAVVETLADVVWDTSDGVISVVV
ncbi:HAD family hydrolase [Propionicicella superfundia]|uniref:HAD family hydrolase n=1 Tax=Propionicicella superfundia TaxID=348582 RepID=UPI0006873050|nr:HAD-IA family hydrolase [Propionicicella superfundia]